MRVFVYEFVTGGGLWQQGALPAESSLLAEGRAMSRAITADLAACEGIEVVTTRDARLPILHGDGITIITVSSAAEELNAIQRLSADSDWTLLIAPETGGALLDRCLLVESGSGRLLSPYSTFVEIAANKHSTAETLSRAQVPVPQTYCGDSSAQKVTRFPLVEKPADGCGSCDIRLISDLASAGPRSAGFRREEYIPGLPASVAVLNGPAGAQSLPCCEQRLSRDGRFTYLGGRLPLPKRLDERARCLAQAAISALPKCVGYIGIDVVLGEAEDGSGDRVIEVNPRLTTSYIGLRAASHANLAAAMLEVATGGKPQLSFSDRHLEFTANGTICE